MSRIKLLASFVLIIFLFFFSAGAVKAADLEVVCTFGSCSSTGDKPLFSETNIFPGWSKTKVVKAVNNYGQAAVFAIKVVNLIPVGGLSDVLTISIKKSGEIINIYEDNLTNFKNYGFLPLSTIAESQEYDFAVRMQESAGNGYQGLSALFDLDLGFEVVPVEETPTPTSAPEVCSAPAPSAPTNLTAVSISSSVIQLSWTAPPETVTHYSISYGLNLGSYIYGNANIGNVVSYVVSELSSGTTYYFVVHAVNDCADSSASNEAVATTGGVLGAFIAGGPAPGFEVLGEKTEGELEEGIGQVGGVEARPVCPWWLILSLLELILAAVYYWLIHSDKKPRKNWFVIPIVLGLLAFIGDQVFAHKVYEPSKYCAFMWLWALLAFLVPTAFHLYFRKK